MRRQLSVFACRESVAGDDQMSDEIIASPPSSLRSRYSRFFSESDDSSQSTNTIEVCMISICCVSLY